MFKCYVCGREIDFNEVALIKGSEIVVCKKCLPMYYVKNMCRLVNRRLSGEELIACQYCKFKKECDEYISRLKK